MGAQRSAPRHEKLLPPAKSFTTLLQGMIFQTVGDSFQVADVVRLQDCAHITT